jgi:hypothetical protein
LQIESGLHVKARVSTRFSTHIEEHEEIHAAERAAFAKRATSDTNSGSNHFAPETYRIVQRRLGELGAVGYGGWGGKSGGLATELLGQPLF